MQLVQDACKSHNTVLCAACYNIEYSTYTWGWVIGVYDCMITVKSYFVSNRRQLDCLFNSLFRLSKISQKSLRLGILPHNGPVIRISMPWHRHDLSQRINSLVPGRFSSRGGYSIYEHDEGSICFAILSVWPHLFRSLENIYCLDPYIWAKMKFFTPICFAKCIVLPPFFTLCSISSQ